MSSERRKSRTVYVLRWSRPMRSASARLTPAANLRRVRGLAALGPLPAPAVAPGEHGSWDFRGGHFRSARSGRAGQERRAGGVAGAERRGPGRAYGAGDERDRAHVLLQRAPLPFAARLRVTSPNQVKRAKLGSKREVTTFSQSQASISRPSRRFESQLRSAPLFGVGPGRKINRSFQLRSASLPPSPRRSSSRCAGVLSSDTFGYGAGVRWGGRWGDFSAHRLPVFGGQGSSTSRDDPRAFPPIDARPRSPLEARFHRGGPIGADVLASVHRRGRGVGG